MPKYEDEGIVEDNDDLETEEGGKNLRNLLKVTGHFLKYCRSIGRLH